MSDFKYVSVKIEDLRKALSKLDNELWDTREVLQDVEGALPRWQEIQDRLNADANRLRETKIRMKANCAATAMYKEIRAWVEELARRLGIPKNHPAPFHAIVAAIEDMKFRMKGLEK